jgi:UrcA family protein
MAPDDNTAATTSPDDLPHHLTQGALVMKSNVLSSATRLRSRPLVALAFGLSLIGSGSLALANEPATGPSVSRSATVSLSGIDLSTPEGAGAARQKIRQAARSLCSRLEDPTDLGHQQHFVACVDDAVAKASLPVSGRLVASKGN